MRSAAIINFDLSDVNAGNVEVEFQEPDQMPRKERVSVKWFAGRFCEASGDAPLEVLEAVEREVEANAKQERITMISGLGRSPDRL